MSRGYWTRAASMLGVLEVAKVRDRANARGTWTPVELEIADSLDDAYVLDDGMPGPAALLLADGDL